MRRRRFDPGEVSYIGVGAMALPIPADLCFHFGLWATGAMFCVMALTGFFVLVREVLDA